MTNASEAMQVQSHDALQQADHPLSDHAATIGLGALTHQQFHLQLNFALQRTLDLEQQMRTYFHSVASRHGVESICYTFPEQNIDFALGHPRHHSCNYRLVTDSQFIGELTLTRRIRFSTEEIQALEQATGSLAYPLRNALQFRQALKNATTDPLTGAGNRSALEEAAQQEFENLRRYNRPFAIAMIDLDRFKHINDRYGHSAGDTVLKAIARHIQQNSRSTDRFFRYGGEEFVLVMATTDKEGALINAERLRAMVAGLSCVHEDQDIPVTMSVGLASAKPDEDLRQLLNRADAALYRAKTSGRNRVMNETEQASQTADHKTHDKPAA